MLEPSEKDTAHRQHFVRSITSLVAVLFSEQYHCKCLLYKMATENHISTLKPLFPPTRKVTPVIGYRVQPLAFSHPSYTV